MKSWSLTTILKPLIMPRRATNLREEVYFCSKPFHKVLSYKETPEQVKNTPVDRIIVYPFILKMPKVFILAQKKYEHKQ